MDQETVYVTTEDSHIVMSAKVQSLAGGIYQEFEKMIHRYDRDVVKDLMPLVVNVLEYLDVSYTENQELLVEVELVKEDNEQLVTQYEREKQLRKGAEQKLLEMEDLVEDERKEKGGKIESLESIVKMLELKSKNASDQVYRLEEKEQQMKSDYVKLHERYTELFKNHAEYIDRTKILLSSSDRVDVRPRMTGLPMSHLNRSSGPVSFGFQSLEGGLVGRLPTSPGDFQPTLPASPPESNHSTPSLRNELGVVESPEEEVSLRDKGWSETLSPASKEPTSPDISEESLPPPQPVTNTTPSRITTKTEQRIGNTLYQELSFQDSDALNEIDEGADITGNWVHPGDYASSGMGKEVENLIMENNELLATKNALNIVKDDLIIKVDELTSEQEILREELKSLQALKARLMIKVSELEEELKKTKEELEKANKATKSDDEEDVPMAQRKRFTRVEMARVLMERNQYKEKYMELQEAMRFRDMLRANKEDPALDNKKSFWSLFSNLLTIGGGARSGDKLVRRQQQAGSHYALAYHPTASHLSPTLDTMRKKSLHDRKRLNDFSEQTNSDLGGEAVWSTRKSGDELRSVKAHVGRREDGRLQAYGWSLPAQQTRPQPPPRHPPPPPSAHVPVPVPVYCRPLMEKDDSMKMWCAAAVNLTGGVTRDGGSIVGASVFYSRENEEEPKTEDGPSTSGVEDDPSQIGPIQEIEKDLKEGEKGMKDRSKQRLSSLVWICTSSRSVSYVTVIDANNPADILEVFSVCQSCLLCITSVPGASEEDYKERGETEDERGGQEEGVDGPVSSEDSGVAGEDQAEDRKSEEGADSEDGDARPLGRITFVSCATGSEPTDHLPPTQHTPAAETVSFTDANSNEVPSCSPVKQRRLVKHFKEGLLKDGVSEVPQEKDLAYEELEKMSSVLPTMWLGSQNGYIFVHSAMAQWKRCIHSKKLRDSVLSIVHCYGRVVCSLADCTLAVFSRGHDAQWNLSSYHLVDLGRPQANHSIRCLTAVHLKVWCGYKNNIHIFDPQSMQLQRSFEVHPHKESQVRAMAWLGDGVWVSIRLDSTLRLYHAHTYEHLQDVDIEPYVSKMLGTGKLGFSFVRITSLLIACSRLWIGTGNGVIISVPLSDSSSSMKVYADPDSTQLTPSTFIPYCSMQHAQLSFHGHRDSVKFFIAVPGSGGLSSATSIPESIPVIDNAERPSSMLVMSGGEGYVDFRVDDSSESEEDGVPSLARIEPCYLIIWQVTPPPLPTLL